MAGFADKASGATKAEDSLDPRDSFLAFIMASDPKTKTEAMHGVCGRTCTSCPDCRICDCPCDVCTHARRREAGLVCTECDKDCGFSQCDDCYDKEEDDRARAEDEPPVCYDCNQEWCPGGCFCPANHPPDDDSDDEEMHRMMEEEREEEDRRFSRTAVRLSAPAFRAQMARYRASKPTYTGPTITVTLTPTSATSTYNPGAAAGAGGK